ncbi:hypothetical protein [Bizionia paragorgiae]|jgi:predicted flap endonuclease-1-like 5' DNA nuclease|uniref:hypothetical protein n=1 Tax=Bizionia paragorgiae TaxID=283786 RepID=UPI00299F3097|nr:hypothetical protein [Bizionia paragorgiae]MDX1272355.1 hypothetical protein [Bizionia paragorgiae]
MNWCILIPLIVGLLSAIFGYLIGKISGGASPQTESTNTDIFKNRIAKLEADLEACKASKLTSKKPAGKPSGAGNAGADSSMMTSNFVSPQASVDSPLPSSSSAVAFDAVAAKAAMGKAVKDNDLKVVEGIGPKIAELFHSHNIKTWYDLSQCTVEKCTEILRAGGKRFEIHKPFTWPKQAKLAHEGQWQKLKEWQDVLDKGQ